MTRLVNSSRLSPSLGLAKKVGCLSWGLFSGFITFAFEGIHNSRTDPFPEKNSQILTIANVSRAQYLSSWEWISALPL